MQIFLAIPIAFRQFTEFDNGSFLAFSTAPSPHTLLSLHINFTPIMNNHCLSSHMTGPFPPVATKGAALSLEAEVVKGLSYLHYAAKTLLLFTYTDYKTIFIPIVSRLFNGPDWDGSNPSPDGFCHRCRASFVASALFEGTCMDLVGFLSSRKIAASLISSPRVHLLQCNTSNQAKSREEDAVNRPWRPIPAGRISEQNVALLRAFLVPFCILFSASFGLDVAAASVLLTITTIVYDEFKLAGHWLGKNFCNIGGYVSFQIGATKIMGKPVRSFPLRRARKLMLLIRKISST